MPPFFTIIIPSFNRAHVLLRAIQSVLEQSYDGFELIVVDDGSSDNTKEAVEGCSDDRLRYHYKTNGGVCTARNIGAALARGEYIVFLDSDDMVTSHWLADFKEAIDLESPDAVFCNMNRSNSLMKTLAVIDAGDAYGTGKGLGIFIPGAFCLKTTVFLSVGGYDENLKYGENTELRLRLFATNPTTALTHKVGLIYEPSADGGSKQLGNMVKSNLYIIEKHRAYFNSRQDILKLYLQSIAVAMVRLGQFKQAPALFYKACFLKPYSIKSVIRLGLSLLPFIAQKVWPKK